MQDPRLRAAVGLEPVPCGGRVPDPGGLPGQAPYAFWVRGGLALSGGAQPTNYTFPSTSTPWGDEWGQFSWQPASWAPGPQPGQGTTMVDFVRSFADRLRELN